MADGDFVVGDENLLHEEPDDTLPFGDVQGCDACRNSRFAWAHLDMPIHRVEEREAEFR